MSVLCDYFTAATDDDAAAMVEDGPDGELLLLELKGITPFDLVDVEALLTGAEVREPRIIASREDNHLLVVTLNDELRDALATADAERLAAVARSWSIVREQPGQDADVDAWADLLGQFAWLAREAKDDGLHLYCWIAV